MTDSDLAKRNNGEIFTQSTDGEKDIACQALMKKAHEKYNNPEA